MWNFWIQVFISEASEKKTSVLLTNFIYNMHSDDCNESHLLRKDGFNLYNIQPAGRTEQIRFPKKEMLKKNNNMNKNKVLSNYQDKIKIKLIIKIKLKFLFYTLLDSRKFFLI